MKSKNKKLIVGTVAGVTAVATLVGSAALVLKKKNGSYKSKRVRKAKRFGKQNSVVAKRFSKKLTNNYGYYKCEKKKKIIDSVDL